MSKKNPKKKLVLRKPVDRDSPETTEVPEEELAGEEETTEEPEEEAEVPSEEELAAEPPEEPDDEPAPHIPSFLEKKPPSSQTPAHSPAHSPAPTSGKKPKMEEWEKQLLEHLQFVRDYHEVTVPQFRNFANLGDDARRVLDQYVAQELMEETWRDNAGRYLLTAAGEARRLELGGAPLPPMTTMPVVDEP